MNYAKIKTYSIENGTGVRAVSYTHLARAIASSWRCPWLKFAPYPVSMVL